MHRARPPHGARPFAAHAPVYPFASRLLKERFLDLVRRRLGRDGARVVIAGGVARVEGNPAAHGLTNLAQVCHQNSTTAWPMLVDEHFDKSEPERMLAKLQMAFGSGSGPKFDRLALRIQAEDFMPAHVLATLVHRVDLPGTVTTLVVDVGESVMPLPLPIAEEWGVPADELFERALANLPRLCQARWQRLVLPYDTAVEVDAFCGDFYSAASLLRPQPFLPRGGEHGHLFVVPAREALVSWPVGAAGLPRAIEALVAIGRGKFEDGPGSITPHVFWRTPAGDFELQQGAIIGGRAQLAPSPAFAQLLARLAP